MEDLEKMVAINCDMGESYGLYSMGDDASMMPLISLANVACGFHGSDANHMRTTVKLAKQTKVKVGAHPSLPDLQGFGRREMQMEREELANIIIYQVGALIRFSQSRGYGTQSHQTPWRLIRNGVAPGTYRACDLRCSGRIQCAAVGHGQYASRKDLPGTRSYLHRGVLCRSVLQGRWRTDHHQGA